MDTRVRNAKCLRHAFPSIDVGKTEFRLSDLASGDAPGIPTSVTRTVEAEGKMFLITADEAPAGSPEPFVVRVYDASVPERPVELESSPARSVDEAFAKWPEAATRIEEWTFRGVGPARATVVVRNGQLERIGTLSDLRCEVDPGASEAESARVADLVCECAN